MVTATSWNESSLALVGEADKSLKAIDRILADTRLCAHQKACPDMKLSLGLCQQRKAAVTTEQKASPELGLEEWHFYSRTKSRSICNLLEVCLQTWSAVTCHDR